MKWTEQSMNDNPICIFTQGINLRRAAKVLLVLWDQTWQPVSACKPAVLLTIWQNDGESRSRLFGGGRWRAVCCQSRSPHLHPPITAQQEAKAANRTQATADLFALERRGKGRCSGNDRKGAWMSDFQEHFFPIETHVDLSTWLRSNAWESEKDATFQAQFKALDGFKATFEKEKQASKQHEAAFTQGACARQELRLLLLSRARNVVAPLWSPPHQYQSGIQAPALWSRAARVVGPCFSIKFALLADSGLHPPLAGGSASATSFYWF